MLDLASLAAALDPPVGQVVDLGEVAGHILLFLGQRALVDYRSKLGVECLDLRDVVCVLMVLCHKVSRGVPGADTGGKDQDQDSKHTP